MPLKLPKLLNSKGKKRFGNSGQILIRNGGLRVKPPIKTPVVEPTTEPTKTSTDEATPVTVADTNEVAYMFPEADT